MTMAEEWNKKILRSFPIQSLLGFYDQWQTLLPVKIGRNPRLPSLNAFKELTLNVC